MRSKMRARAMSEQSWPGLARASSGGRHLKITIDSRESRPVHLQTRLGFMV